MKILIHSNGPNVATGYGVQTALLADRLADAGHEVAVSCTFGNQAGVTQWTSPSGHHIRLYPSGFTTPSADIIHAHADHFFGPTRDGWIITLLDVWSLNGHPSLSSYNIVAWTPVDHDPVPPGVVQFFEETNAVPVAMARFGESELRRCGIEASYIPLAVDTDAYRPTFEIAGLSAREFFQLPDGAFVVGMVAMNKDPNDRKGFQEAFLAFAEFQREHPEAVLHIHSEQTGITGGMDLDRLAKVCGIRKGSYQFTDQYAYRIGLTAEQMAALYTAFDVLLAPSAGEGFCVPLIEAQACGVPVIASTFTAQPELVGAGWTVGGQRWWDEASRAWYSRANVAEVVGALEQAHDALKDPDSAESLGQTARQFARTYDATYVFDTFWRPLLAGLDGAPPDDKPAMDQVAVLCPVMKRPQNVAPLVESFDRHNDGSAHLYFVVDADDDDEIAAIKDAGATYLVSDRGTSFACKLNSGFEQTTEDWVLVVGDDVEFTFGWLAAARQLSTSFDVIGTNDAYAGEVRNPRVANGSHADHYFVRRSYVDDDGATLDGPGILAAEAYYHYFVDVETIQLAKALGRFAPCLDCRIVHHQPRYEGRPQDWDADPVYVKGGQHAERDETKFRQRAALIESRKIVKANIW